MYIYILPYLFVLVVAFLVFFIKNISASRFMFFVSLIPAFIIVIFRGHIGIDTPVYEAIIRESYYTGVCRVEPLFCILSNQLFYLFDDSAIVLRVITAIFCFLFFIAFSKKINEIVIACIFIFPVYFYDMSTNGIRYGLAFIIFKIFYSNIKKYVIFSPIHVAIQSSSLILVALSFMKKINFKVLIILSCIFSIVIYMGFDYFNKKLEAYSEYDIPNFYSGILNFLICFVLLCLYKYFKKILFKEFLLCLCYILIFQILSQFTYAGLRMVQLMVFYLAIRATDFFELNKKRSNIYIYIALLVFGLLYFVNLIRIMANSGYYLPYEFIS